MPFVREPKLNAYQTLARNAIAHLFTALPIPLFRRLYGVQTTAAQLVFLQGLPPGTLGRGVADLLARHGLQLIPRYEDHDLKHVLLGYGTTPEDELKLKAFMLGNGDWSAAGVGLSLLAVLTPELWPELWHHYCRGRQARPISHWKLATYAAYDLESLRRHIGLLQAAA